MSFHGTATEYSLLNMTVILNNYDSHFMTEVTFNSEGVTSNWNQSQRIITVIIGFDIRPIFWPGF